LNSKANVHGGTVSSEYIYRVSLTLQWVTNS